MLLTPMQQTMTPDQAMSNDYKGIAFDVTKVWPHEKFPLRQVGELVLNKNPENYFDEIEQVCGLFSWLASWY